MCPFCDMVQKGTGTHEGNEAPLFPSTRLAYGQPDHRVILHANALLAGKCLESQRTANPRENTSQYVEAYLSVANAFLIKGRLSYRSFPMEMSQIIRSCEVAYKLTKMNQDENSQCCHVTNHIS